MVGAEPLHDRLGDVGGGVCALEGHGGLLQGESVYVAIEQRVGVSGHLYREAARRKVPMTAS
jgi:hypothetical protein